jgi:serine O-acetyltransferase
MEASERMPCAGKPAKQNPNIFSLMAEDVRAALERDPAAVNAFGVLTSYPGIQAVWAHRVEHWLWIKGLKWLARASSQITRFFTGIEIHPGASLGRRVFIDHGMGIVIGETAVVGDEVTLYHGVTLGGTSLEKVKRHPTLQPCVVVGAGAKILGDITIGSHSRIGANAVVVKDVPPQSVVVGVPGQVIRRKRLVDEHQTDLSHTKMPDAVMTNLQELMKRLAEVESRLEIHSDQLSQIQLQPDGVWEYSDGPDYII